MGSLATFVKNTANECPVLIKVEMVDHNNARSPNLDFGESGNTNIPLKDRTGLVGIEILRLSNGLNFDSDQVVYL